MTRNWSVFQVFELQDLIKSIPGIISLTNDKYYHHIRHKQFTTHSTHIEIILGLSHSIHWYTPVLTHSLRRTSLFRHMARRTLLHLCSDTSLFWYITHTDTHLSWNIALVTNYKHWGIHPPRLSRGLTPICSSQQLAGHWLTLHATQDFP